MTREARGKRRWFLLTRIMDFSMEFVNAAHFILASYIFSFSRAMGVSDQEKWMYLCNLREKRHWGWASMYSMMRGVTAADLLHSGWRKRSRRGLMSVSY